VKLSELRHSGRAANRRQAAFVHIPERCSRIAPKVGRPDPYTNGVYRFKLAAVYFPEGDF
jgi:hypothetical protein